MKTLFIRDACRERRRTIMSCDWHDTVPALIDKIQAIELNSINRSYRTYRNGCCECEVKYYR